MGNDPTLIAWEGFAWGIPPKFNKIKQIVTYYTIRRLKMITGDLELSLFILILLVPMFLLGSFVTCFWLVLCSMELQPVRVRSSRSQVRQIKKNNNNGGYL